MSERPKAFQPPNPEQRINYKYALLQPYFGVLPPSVVEAMLDLDLIQVDDHGNRINPLGRKMISLYETRLQIGAVDEVINKEKR
jgi:hypothetical protein